MKRIKILLLLSCITYVVQSQSIKDNKIYPHSSIETGYENRELSFGEKQNGVYNMKNSMFSTLTTSSTWRDISIYTSVKVYYKPMQKIYQSPKQTEFIIGGGYSIKNFRFVVEHMCSHSIDEAVFYDSYDRISVKYIIK